MSQARYTLVYPLDDDSNAILNSITESQEYIINELNVTCTQTDASINDIFSACVPHGNSVQCLCVRYTVAPVRVFVDAEIVVPEVESIHIISPTISNEDIMRCVNMVNNGRDILVRITASIDPTLPPLVPARNIGDPYISIHRGKDYILITSDSNLESQSRPLDINDESLTVLGEADSLKYISNHASF